MKKNKSTILALVALVCVAAIFAGVYFATRGETNEGGKTLTIQVVHGNGETKEFTIHTDAEYLGDALKEQEELGIVDGGGDFGLYIIEVDGEPSTDQTWWQVCKDGEGLMVGASQQPIADGEHYELVLSDITEW